MWKFLLCVAVLVASFSVCSSAETLRKVSLGWEISCPVARGSIKKSGANYVFRTSANTCTNGLNQRAEIKSDGFSVKKAVAYLFHSKISMVTESSDDFIIFQVHDGRNGCSPPLSLRWKSNGSLRFDSDYTEDRGTEGCHENSALRSAKYAGPRLQRDGTEYDLQVRLEFNGSGSFEVRVAVDGRQVISGNYAPPSDKGFVLSKGFFLKHGVYSERLFDYVFTSSGMNVYEVSE